MTFASTVSLLGLLLVTQADGKDALPPPAIPSGMDLLYGSRVAVNPNGEPSIAVGLMSGQSQLTVRTDDTVTLDFYERGVHKRTELSGKHTLQAKIIESTAAETSLFVQFETVAHVQRDTIPKVLQTWRDRGYPTVKALEDGTVLGVGGNVIDTRNVRIIARAKTRQQADNMVDEVYRKHNVRASIQKRLHRRPWARLQLFLDGQPLGEATSYLRISNKNAETSLQVDQVEYGKGYKWHGYQPRNYRGDIYLVVDADGALAAVNVLGAESILAGVVPSEIFATSHPESLKAQAVAARNILFSQLGRRHHADPFHLCSAQHCQVYGGITKEKKSTTQAVLETTGIALFKHGHLVNTTYSSTCGGYTEHNHLVWGDRPNSALQAKSDMVHPVKAFEQGLHNHNIHQWIDHPPQTYCSVASKMRSSTFRWSRRYGPEELSAIIESKAPQLGQLTDVQIAGRGPGGRVKSLKLRGTQGEHTIHYELPIRRFFNNLKSGTFVFELEKDAGGLVRAIKFRGGGWGHGVGMCQMGAIGRAESGMDFRKILGHYYNSPSLMKLYEQSSLAP